MKRVAVDIGGTFTDIVVYDEETKTTSRGKTFTVPAAPEEGFFRALSEQGIRAEEISYLVHGTTLVANLIVERKGARVGLITTLGFRDVLEIQRSYRQALYDLQWEKPGPLVPRDLRLEVNERIDAKGHVLVPLDEGELRDRIAELLFHGVQSIAVCFLNAYANSSHEESAARIIGDIAPELPVSISSRVDSMIREYERVSTTVLNAYAVPRMGQYVRILDDAVASERSVLYMHSGGGVIPSKAAQNYPVRLINSGPAAGSLAGGFFARQLGLGSVCTMDMGGTSCDVCVVRDGQPGFRDTCEVAWGIPARTQSIDIQVIGAGGGSLAYVDSGGTLRVGPESAGSEPGPACYGRGGVQPTVTDANLMLGILNPKALLAGEVKLDAGKAQEAIARLARELDADVASVAMGIYMIASTNMSQAIRKITVENGLDPREFTLIAFGGAGDNMQLRSPESWRYRA